MKARYDSCMFYLKSPAPAGLFYAQSLSEGEKASQTLEN
jgi:hypothetical protein